MSRENADLLQSLLSQLTSESSMRRPAVPDTMLGLPCQYDADDLLAVGDCESATGFSDEGLMTLTLSSPTTPYGAVKLNRDQVVQLRDFLDSKLV